MRNVEEIMGCRFDGNAIQKHKLQVVTTGTGIGSAIHVYVVPALKTGRRWRQLPGARVLYGVLQLLHGLKQ